MRRVLVPLLGDIFWGLELAGKELIEAERRYLSKSLLQGVYFSYVYIDPPID